MELQTSTKSKTRKQVPINTEPDLQLVKIKKIKNKKKVPINMEHDLQLVHASSQ
jgi:hypothetical protein